MSQAEFDQLLKVVPSVSRETFDALKRYQALFLKWNERINLASRATLEQLWTRHIVDSAQVIGLMPDARRWVDIGSGGGFPGVVTAILLRDKPGAHVDLVESNGKKASFLRAALAECRAPGHVHAIRIELAARQIAIPECVTARALAPLNDLLLLSEPWLAGGAVGLFHKGREYRTEVSESVNHWTFDLVEHPSRVENDSVILEVRSLRRRDQSR